MKQHKYKNIIFDLDGTLLDTVEDLADSVNFALTAHGYASRTVDEVRSMVGNGISNLISRAVPDGTPSECVTQVLSDFRVHYEQNSQNKTRPYEGIPELLYGLKRSGYVIGVASNKIESSVRSLCIHYFPGLVDGVVGDIPGRPRKPAPDAVFDLMRSLGMTGEDTVYIGDSEVDILTAKNAGLPCISVLWGFRGEDVLHRAGATILRSTPESLAEFLGTDIFFCFSTEKRD